MVNFFRMSELLHSVHGVAMLAHRPSFLRPGCSWPPESPPPWGQFSWDPSSPGFTLPYLAFCSRELWCDYFRLVWTSGAGPPAYRIWHIRWIPTEYVILFLPRFRSFFGFSIFRPFFGFSISPIDLLSLRVSGGPPAIRKPLHSIFLSRLYTLGFQLAIR